MKADDLTRRARELAALAKNATPGPWCAYVYRGKVVGDGVVVASCHCQDVEQKHRDARFIAASHEMTELLLQMADALEAYRAYCKAECHLCYEGRAGTNDMEATHELARLLDRIVETDPIMHEELRPPANRQCGGDYESIG